MRLCAGGMVQSRGAGASRDRGMTCNAMQCKIA
ncbi:hypothetical protein [Caudoviricetes sp.]|nr:hypothetical protein [Caudoviricetes sp.]